MLSVCKRCLKARAECATTSTSRVGRGRTSASISSLNSAGVITFDPATHDVNLRQNETRSGVVESAFDLPRLATTSNTPWTFTQQFEQDRRERHDAPSLADGPRYDMFLQEEPINYIAEKGPDIAPPMKAAYSGRLASLSCRLFTLLKILRSEPVGESLYLTLSSPDPSDTTDALLSSGSSRYPIGDMLEASQEFIEILDEILHPMYTKDISSSSSSSQPANRTPPLSQPRTPSTENVRPHDSFQLDFPIILALITTYVCVVRIYRIVLTQILSSLQNQIISPIDTPPILPGLHLDGFELGPHNNLQARILAEVSMDLLSRMQKTIDAVINKVPGSIQESSPTTVFNMIMKQEADETLERDGRPSASLDDILYELRSHLRGAGTSQAYY